MLVQISSFYFNAVETARYINTDAIAYIEKQSDGTATVYMANDITINLEPEDFTKLMFALESESRPRAIFKSGTNL